MRGNRQRTRIGAAVTAGVSLAVVIGMSGCTPPPPPPQPTPAATVSGFATEVEAFRAAEATYRAYVDALNRVDLADPRTAEAVYRWLDGDALIAEKQSFEKMHDAGWIVSGRSRVSDFLRIDDSARLRALACLDVSSVRLIDANGQRRVDESRQDIYALVLEFSQNERASTGLLITSSKAVKSDRC